MKKVVLLLIVLTSFSCFSATRTSTAAGGAWNLGTSWVGGVAPGAGDIAVIATTGAGVITVTANATCTRLTVNAGAVLTINAGVTLTSDMTAFQAGSNDGTINGGGNFTLEIALLTSFTNNSTMTIGTLNFGNGLSLFSSLNNNGTINLTTLLVSPLAFYNNNNGGVLNISGLGTPVTINGGFDCTANTNTVNYNGAGNQNIENSTYYNLTLSNSGTKALAGTQDVDNDLTISNPVTLNSNGFDMTVGGDWINNSTFTQGTRRVTFDGAQAQTIGGTNSTTFYNVTINNSFGTSPQLSLAINETVTNGLTLTNGITNLAGFRLTLGTSGANPGTLVCIPTSNNFLTGGNFTRWFGTSTIAAGNVNGLFPMGNITGTDYYASFYVTCPVTAPTTGGSVTVTYSDPFTIQTVNFSDGEGSTVVKRHDDIWGVSTGSLAGGSYVLRAERTFTVGYVGLLSDLRLTQLASAVGNSLTTLGSLLLPQVNRTNITLAQLTNNFYIGSINAVQSPLPIELLTFDAVMNKNNKVDVNWSTATEKNNDYFTVQRSADGINFADVGRVKGAGNSLYQINYSYVDESPLEGVSYYRLKQTDLDKTFTYSGLSVVNLTYSSKGLTIYPNPTNSTIRIAFKNSGNGAVEIRIRDVNGKAVLYAEKHFGETGNSVDVDLSTLESGVYFVSVTVNGKTTVQKIVKQ